MIYRTRQELDTYEDIGVLPPPGRDPQVGTKEKVTSPLQNDEGNRNELDIQDIDGIKEDSVLREGDTWTYEELIGRLGMEQKTSERKCPCGCGKPGYLVKHGNIRMSTQQKRLKDELFVRFLEEGAPLEIAAQYIQEDARKEMIAKSKREPGPVTREDMMDMGFYPTEALGSKSLHKLALRRITRMPTELKKRILEAAPKALIRMYQLLDAKKEVFHQGQKVGETTDNEVRFKASKDLLDRTLGKPEESLKIEQEVKQLNVNVSAKQKLNEDFTSFIKDKYGQKKAEASPEQPTQ